MKASTVSLKKSKIDLCLFQRKLYKLRTYRCGRLGTTRGRVAEVMGHISSNPFLNLQGEKNRNVNHVDLHNVTHYFAINTVIYNTTTDLSPYALNSDPPKVALRVQIFLFLAKLLPIELVHIIFQRILDPS